MVNIDNTQLKKGVLDLCVLAMLRKKEHYGYELVSEISKNILISEGTIYPLLKRLRDEGHVTTYLQESREGPPRKYYRLTEGGRRIANDLVAEWVRFSQGVNRIVKEHDANEQE